MLPAGALALSTYLPLAATLGTEKSPANASIPLFMALAAFIPDTWSSETRFFFMSIILGFIG